MKSFDVKKLEEIALDIRCKTISCIGHLGVGHIGGALSIVELLTALYFEHMAIDVNNPQWEDRDRLVLSKGHAGPALYATLATKGFFPDEWLNTLNQGGTRLPSHCDRTKTPGIDMSTGSLGQGISAACGIAYANRMNDKKNYVYAVIGDGETNEGQNWEAAMFAAHQKLNKLIVFTDCNKLQIDGTTDEVCSLGDLEGKWKTFGWFTQRVDGHNFEALCGAIETARQRSEHDHDEPCMIIMDTIKGKGANFCEGDPGNHNMVYDMEVANKAIEALRNGR